MERALSPPSLQPRSTRQQTCTLKAMLNSQACCVVRTHTHTRKKRPTKSHITNQPPPPHPHTHTHTHTHTHPLTHTDTKWHSTVEELMQMQVLITSLLYTGIVKATHTH